MREGGGWGVSVAVYKGRQRMIRGCRCLEDGRIPMYGDCFKFTQKRTVVAVEREREREIGPKMFDGREQP